MNMTQLTETLAANADTPLLFEVNGKTLHPTYHITEIKNASYQSVDCGGQPHQWQETILQLWLWPEEVAAADRSAEPVQPITGNKALGIAQRVDQISPINNDALLRVEYREGNADTAAIYQIDDVRVNADEVRVILGSVQTQCKPMTGQQATRENSCGTPEPKTACC